MHIFSLAGLMLLSSVGSVQADTNNPSGVVEVDLLFPRNDTYAPTEIMPIVFGFQNAELAPLIAPSISLTLWDMNNGSRSLNDPLFGFDLKSTNFSSNNGSAYYAYHPVIQPGLKTESSYMLKWTFFWTNCTEETKTTRGPKTIESNSSTWSLLFTIKNGAKSMDVGSISEGCPKEDQGFALNVIATHKVAPGAAWSGGETCGEVASSIPNTDPCRTQVSPSAASSISASIVSQLCNSVNGASLVDCPPKEENSGAPKASVWSMIGLMLGLGAASQIWI